MKNQFYHRSTKIGIALSFICAIHCVLMPILMIVFPFLNNTFLHDPAMEWSILISLIALGSLSLNHYRKKHHGSNLPIILFSVGVIICLMALLGPHSRHHILMMTGSIIIAIGQILNFTIRKSIPPAIV